MKELEEIKSLIKTKSNPKYYNKYYNKLFSKYGEVYIHTNENLKDYLPDLTDKRVLSVSASGDQLLNIMGKGAIDIDTFDINAISPLLQNLKICATQYLPYEYACIYLDKIISNIYYKFNDKLSKREKNFFDYLYEKYTLEDIYRYLFFPQNLDNMMNNNYFDYQIFYNIKYNIKYLKNNHYTTDIFQLAHYLHGKYDAIFLSNISHYSNNPQSFISYLMYLKNYYLTSNGCIYYGYLYDKEINDKKLAIKSLNNLFAKTLDLSYYDEFIDSTELINIDSAENHGIKKDTVLVLHK